VVQSSGSNSALEAFRRRLAAHLSPAPVIDQRRADYSHVVEVFSCMLWNLLCCSVLYVITVVIFAHCRVVSVYFY